MQATPTGGGVTRVGGTECALAARPNGIRVTRRAEVTPSRIRHLEGAALVGAELTATVVYMVNAGHVRLIGNFRGTRFDLETLASAA